MVTETICRLLSTYYLSVFDHFVGLTFKGVNFKSQFHTNLHKGLVKIFVSFQEGITRLLGNNSKLLSFFKVDHIHSLIFVLFFYWNQTYFPSVN